MQKYCLCNYFCNINSCFALSGLIIPGKLSGGARFPGEVLAPISIPLPSIAQATHLSPQASYAGRRNQGLEGTQVILYPLSHFSRGSELIQQEKQM